MGARSWKSFDWDAMNCPHENGLIPNPATKAKSVTLTEAGLRRAGMVRLAADPRPSDGGRVPRHRRGRPVAPLGLCRRHVATELFVLHPRLARRSEAGAELRPSLYEEYVRLERRIGHMLSPSVSAYSIPARTRIVAVFSMSSFIAVASAVLNPIQRMSRAPKRGSAQAADKCGRTASQVELNPVTP